MTEQERDKMLTIIQDWMETQEDEMVYATTNDEEDYSYARGKISAYRQVIGLINRVYKKGLIT